MAYIGKIVGIQYTGGSVGQVAADFYNDNTYLGSYGTTYSLSGLNTSAAVDAAAMASLATYASAQGYTGITWFWMTSTPAAVDTQISAAIAGLSSPYVSYQALASQVGTSAPSATSLTNSTGKTFIWARTGAGVYTITASSATFTAGKTGIFLQPLTNLNGAIRAVVTSSTVITITTAIQSLAVLGLLGFTATATDALLDSTLVEIRIYS